MHLRRYLLSIAFMLWGTICWGQAKVAQPPARLQPAAAGAPAVAAPATATPDAKASSGPKWKSPNKVVRASGTSEAPVAENQPADTAPTTELRSVEPAPRQAVARASNWITNLPNDAGQIGREYDISPYTARVTSTNQPERAIVDWILRETGYEAWHTQPLAVLSADSRTLRVYHTPDVQAAVAEIVDRFVNTEAESHAFNMRVITIGGPTWRTKAHRMLRPIAVQAQGVQAWLLAKEDAALLVADMRRRNDFLEHSTPHLLVNNGQSKQVSAPRPRPYTRDVLLKAPASWPSFEPQQGQYEEGFKLEFKPLLSLDGRVIDAVIRCDVDQVEKMLPVTIDVPSAAAPRQKQTIEVPQAVSVRLHEKFRWPADQVLLISLGVVPTPVPINATLTNPWATQRADLLIFVESKGKVVGQPAATAGAPPKQNNGRY